MRICIGIVVIAAAGLTGCVSTYASDPVMGANAAAKGEPQAFSVMMFDHPDETAPMPTVHHSPAVAGR
ncbi:hypothetical protein Q1W73_09020 [Asticcacaulis sp. ZE23SCel15]|uniref:hypothetical protein n=1 Tax=Asticcacaulis sp. ZE23SCel15 TaxID=3059027 RepID=UPI00265F8D56|nr:hypothetical protein [Asticcacaulis sp. ZE23SCel15]WKL55848.1 hypothetical protein Q1W73_09020 [Asticcacaulis sp. ZE23SCel15]